MRKNLPFFMTPLFLSVISVLFFLPGCKKVFDYLLDHPDAAPCFCRIEQFSYSSNNSVGFEGNGRDTVVFSYNTAGNPTTAIRPYPGTGYPNFAFRYDQHERLTDLIGVYQIDNISNGVIAESWHRYFYDSRNRIVIDSFYLFPLIENGRPTIGDHGALSFLNYDYDAEDRIIAAHVHIGSIAYTSTYSYDSNGNLVGSAHDNKVNLHRTNKIWMFLDRDYSMNNPLPANYSYNSFGLPVKIVPPSGTQGSFFSVIETALEYTEADIRYTCK
jgi:hypothetical protein